MWWNGSGTKWLVDTLLQTLLLFIQRFLLQVKQLGLKNLECLIMSCERMITIWVIRNRYSNACLERND